MALNSRLGPSQSPRLICKAATLGDVLNLASAHPRQSSFRNGCGSSGGVVSISGQSIRFPGPLLRRNSFTCSQFGEKATFGSAEPVHSLKNKAPPCSCDMHLVRRGSVRPDFVWQLAEFVSPVLQFCSVKNLQKIVQGGGAIEGGLGNSERTDAAGEFGRLSRILLGCAFVTPAVGASSGVWSMDDFLAGVITLCGALGFLQMFNELAKRDVFDKKLSRKLVHIGVGLGFMLFWPLFTIAPIARYLAAFVPAANGVRMLGIGLGLLKNEAVVKAMSREGDHRELLKGPFYYALAVALNTVGFWRSSPVGIVAIVNMCAGDGFADVIGRNFSRSKLPYNKDKSYAGSLAFFVMSSLISMLYLSYFSAFGFLTILPGTLVGVLLVSSITALVESLPISTHLDDNLTVPFTAVGLGMLLLPSS